MLLGLWIVPSVVWSAKPSTTCVTKVVAQQGYWKGVACANSMESFVKAIDAGMSASEIDVHATADGVVVLYHDDFYNGQRVDGMEYASIAEYRLPSGERLSTLDDLLKVARKHRATRLIIEIKPHENTQKDEAAADAILGWVRKNRMEGRVDYISFSRAICERLIDQCAKAKVDYLGCNLTPKELSQRGYAGLDYNIDVMRAHPEWFNEARELGLSVNVWTLNNETDMRWAIDQGADYITTEEPVMLQRLLETYK